jgi:hypothetical protein
MLRKAGSGNGTKLKDLLTLGPRGLGQSRPQQCPHLEDAQSAAFSEPLGEPLSVRQVAAVIGCSAWTVRQRYLSAGLPHFRSGPNGKLIFYRNQIIRWLLAQQQKGGQIT